MECHPELSKAFDPVNRRLLLPKLRATGTGIRLLKRVSKFLVGRILYVHAKQTR